MVKEHRGLPFELKLPNEKTRKVIKEARKGKNLIEVKNIKELEKTIK